MLYNYIRSYSIPYVHFISRKNASQNMSITRLKQGLENRSMKYVPTGYVTHLETLSLAQRPWGKISTTSHGLPETQYLTCPTNGGPRCIVYPIGAYPTDMLRFLTPGPQ